MEYLSSLANNRIKDIVKLMKSARFRAEKEAFVAEGLRLVSEVPEDSLKELYIEEEFYDKTFSKEDGSVDDRLAVLLEKAEESRECYLVSSTVMKKMSDTENPQGILAVVKRKCRAPEELVGADEANSSTDESDRSDTAEGSGVMSSGEPAEESGVMSSGEQAEETRVSALKNAGDASDRMPFIIVMDRLQDPGNMGTIIRTAEGAGVTGILVSSDSVDPFSPKVVRSTMGSVFRMKICITEDLPGDIEKLRKAGITVFGTHLSGNEFYNEDFTGAAAFLIGNEGRGLSDAVSRKADRLLRIPMEGKVESLNAGISAAVVMYEVLRQRRK